VIGFYAAVAAGGAIGASARWAISEAMPAGDVGSLPASTLAVNLAGCLLLGVFLAAAASSQRWARWRPFLAVGVLGGFTTYSAFAVESVELFEAGAEPTAVGYITVSILGGLLAVRLGEVIVGAAGGRR
jgi:CrcB protein